MLRLRDVPIGRVCLLSARWPGWRDKFARPGAPAEWHLKFARVLHNDVGIGCGITVRIAGMDRDISADEGWDADVMPEHKTARLLRIGAPVAMIATTTEPRSPLGTQRLVGEIVFVEKHVLDGIYEGIRISDGKPCCFFVDDYVIEECLA